ncbi:MAG: 5'-nucleotidase SurE [Candidatus Hydrogenedentes bacterium ADurb.Bin101]|jgi:5'-nucleotidase|nr:MAG: 5'-nucleotidase SurE [Candidatus Hydrogenedentes bacterium ADurb.Bin101]HOC70424.1 5'/3'-nucleotidase SurE [Candidatus Hydrogenedentota bacterium]
MTPPTILLTNDDGIRAPGLTHLAEALSGLGNIFVYAPDRQRSAVGHGVSLHHPLRVTETQSGWYMIDGTPADCMILAVRKLLGCRPDLVVSGINPGANLGDDVTYSGTVAGAFEGMLLGIPSFAISIISSHPNSYEPTKRVASCVAEYILNTGLPKDVMLNVNVPNQPLESIAGMALTSMGRRNYQDEIVERKDPRNGTYYWIGGAEPDHYIHEGSDFEAIHRNQVSITPLRRNITDYDALEVLRSAFTCPDSL